MCPVIMLARVCFLSSLQVGSPFVQNQTEPFREGCFKKYLFPRDRVNKSKCAGMKSLPWQLIEAVDNKLFILGECGAPEDLVPPVFRIIENGV